MSTVATKSPRLPRYISILLVLLLGISAAKLMWLIITPIANINSHTNPATPLSGINNSAQAALVNYGKLIADFHLFGEVTKEPVVTSNVPTNPVVTKPVPKKLDLKLHGIVAYKNKAGYALISSSGGSQKVYGKGDEIEENVVISNLYPEKVVINNNGATEELILPRTEKKSSSRSTNSSLPGNIRKPKGSPNRRRMSPPGSRAAPNSLANFRKEILESPSKLMDVATPSPATENGEFIGFRVQPGKNRKIFRKIGLRANDIILSVNGILLDDASKGAMALGELRQASSVDLVIKRGDDQLSLSHSF